MATKKNISLFKDRITKSSRKEMAREVMQFISFCLVQLILMNILIMVITKRECMIIVQN